MTDAPRLIQNNEDPMDRYSDSGYSPTDYFQQFLPERRYLDYIVDYLAFTADIQDGTLDEISDDAILRLSWAAKDEAAIKYGLSKAHANPDDREIFDFVFGDGYTKVNGLERYDIPRINYENPKDYEAEMIAKIGGDTYFAIDPGEQSMFYPHNRSTLAKLDSRVRKFALGMVGDEPTPGAENLFAQGSRESRPEESFGSDLYDAAGTMTGIGTDLYVGGRVGIPVVKGAVGLAAKGARAALGSETAFKAAPTIVKLLRMIGNSGVTSRQARIATQLGLFAQSEVTRRYSQWRGQTDDTAQYERERLGSIRQEPSGLTQADRDFFETPSAYSFFNPLARDARKTDQDIGAPQTMTQTGDGEWEAEYGPR